MSVFDATELSAWEPVARAATSVGLGALVGIERELDGHDAGVRTHALLSLGAAVFGMLSVGAFVPFVAERAASNVTLDVSRIASYVVAGVGFLAGGTIIKRRRRVRGLTTAASLWVTTAIGLACGLGLYVAAVIATGAALVLLLLDVPLQRLIRRERHVTMRVDTTSIGAARDVLGWLRDRHAGVATVRFGKRNGRAEVVVRGVPALALVREIDHRWPILRTKAPEPGLGRTSITLTV